MTIFSKSIRGIYWNSFSQVIDLVAQIIFTAILARLLIPEDFGLIGMAMVMIRFAEMLKGLGLGGALIQSKENTHEQLSTVFWLNILVSLSLSLLLIACSPLVSIFYKKENIILIFIVLSVNLFLSSFRTVHESILNRNLEFKILAQRNIASVFISNSLAIVFAILGFGVWSLVIRILSSTVISNLLIMYRFRWHPVKTFDLKSITGLLHFGGYMTLTQFFVFFTKNIDFLLVGKFIGAEALGYYSMAFNLSVFPGDQIKNVITSVLFPSFSKLKNNFVKLFSAYRETLFYTSVVLLPILVGLAALSKEFVIAVYGVKWIPSIILIQILVIAGFSRGLIYITRLIILGVGDARGNFLIEVFQGVVMVLAIYLSVLSNDLIKVAIAYSTVHLLFLIFNLYYSNNILKQKLFDTLKLFYKPIIASVVMVVLLFLSRSLISEIDFNVIINLISLIIIGSIAYTASIYLSVSFTEKDRILQILRSPFNKVKNEI